MEVSKTSFVILGMLRLGRRTGYEIKALVDVSTRFFWAAGYGQIYPELARLEELGLVKGPGGPLERAAPKAYDLTRSGRTGAARLAHVGGTASHRAAARGRAEVLLLRRAHAARSSSTSCAGCATRTLAGRRAAARDRDGRLRTPSPPAPLLTLEFGIAYQEFLADWCERAEERLAARAPINRSDGSPADRP